MWIVQTLPSAEMPPFCLVGNCARQVERRLVVVAVAEQQVVVERPDLVGLVLVADERVEVVGLLVQPIRSVTPPAPGDGEAPRRRPSPGPTPGARTELDRHPRGGHGPQGRVFVSADVVARPLTPDREIVEVGDDVEQATAGRSRDRLVVGAIHGVGVGPTRVTNDALVVEGEATDEVDGADHVVERQGRQRVGEPLLAVWQVVGFDTEQDADLGVASGGGAHVGDVPVEERGRDAVRSRLAETGRDQVVRDADLGQPQGADHKEPS
jgi:hypothetical protein